MTQGFQPPERFYIESYSFDSFKEAVASSAGTSVQIIESKQQICYLNGYLNDLKCKTFLVEKDYIDRDFFEDYANNFVKCFYPYSSRCSRLHFFETAFVLNDFENILRGHAEKLDIATIQNAYLGFMVIKPLPKTIIGRVCLKTYPRDVSDATKRYYPATRSYKSTLFGVNLKIENSLAFQEQDSEVGVCATSALWSVFHGTGILYQHPILSPGEITKVSIGHETIDNILSGEGLTTKQIANAMRSVRLKPLALEKFENQNYLKRVLYAYLKAKIPIIMGFELVDTTQKDDDGGNAILGYHAVVVNGFSICDDDSPGTNDETICLKSSKIIKLYVHDDKIGPFARMFFVREESQSSGNNTKATGLLLDRSLQNNEHLRANPDVLIIPLYHKIRILSEEIYDAIKVFNIYINVLRRAEPDILTEEIEWDIYLVTVNDYKNSIINSQSLNEETRLEVLLENMPKYIWCANGYSNGNQILDLLFDATDIKQGKIFVRAVEYDYDFSVILRTAAQSPQIERSFRNMAASAIIEWFRQQS